MEKIKKDEPYFTPEEIYNLAKIYIPENYAYEQIKNCSIKLTGSGTGNIRIYINYPNKVVPRVRICNLEYAQAMQLYHKFKERFEIPAHCAVIDCYLDPKQTSPTLTYTVTQIIQKEEVKR